MASETLATRLEAVLNQSIEKLEPVGGGSSFPAYKLTTATQTFFVKTQSGNSPVFFKEKNGLLELAKFKAPCPKVVHAEAQLLVLENISTEAPRNEYWSNLALELANLHRQRAESFGFLEDNYIGRSEQKNSGHQESWSEFFWHNRILHKVNQLGSSASQFFTAKRIQSLKDICFALLKNHHCYPSPLHGDLWRGNILCDAQQKAYLIDPAFYFGDREADLAMTECFGGFPQIFYQKYFDEFPLDSGYEHRKHLYNLYHMLNHWVIFGDSYRSAVEGIIQHLEKAVNLKSSDAENPAGF